MAVIVFLFSPCGLFAAEDGGPRTGISVRVVDQDQNLVDKAKVAFQKEADPASVATTHTAEGMAFHHLAPGSYSLIITAAGFEEVRQEKVQVYPGEVTEVVFTLRPATQKQQVTVNATADAVATGEIPTQVELKREDVKTLPSHPATVAETLPLVPGVVRGPDGFMEISGASEDHSAMLVNSADVTDPGTGQFGPTVPIDSVESVEVSKTPYLAQYGRFTAGLVTVTTRRGGEKWHFELNDPLPEFRIRSMHLRGLKSMSPRVSLNGPLKKDRLYFAEGFEFNLSKNSVRTLPFPYNETRKQSVNSFSQLDLILSPKHVMTFTGHIVPAETTHANLDFFNPQPVTPNIDSRDMTFATLDRWELGPGVLQTALNGRLANVETYGGSTLPMMLSPEGNAGNYFARKLRRSWRTDLLENFAMNPRQALGTHNLQIGGSYGFSAIEGRFAGQDVVVTDSAAQVLQQVTFSGNPHFARENSEFSGYVQDHWVLHPRVAVDAGLRWEAQTISKSTRLAPRGGFTWSPFASQRTIVRGGAGLFYERIPLSTFAFSSYPQQDVTFFEGGMITDGPRRFINEVSLGGFGGARRRPLPRTIGWSVELEQEVSPMLKLRMGYLQNEGRKLVTLRPRNINGVDALVLEGSGSSSYRQLELTSKWKFNQGSFLFAAYTRSLSQTTISDATSYLGNLPQPLVRDAHRTNSMGSVPNRVLVWGELALKWKFRISPLIEQRTGFPYAVRDASQNYVGKPFSSRTRYPMFFSFDTSISKDLQVTKKYAAQLTVRGLNLTNHFNPLAVHSNTGDPRFGAFFGNYNRRFRLDFDVLF